MAETSTETGINQGKCDPALVKKETIKGSLFGLMAAAITLLSSIFTEISVRGSFYLSVGLSIIAFAVVATIYHSYVKAYAKTFFYKVTDQFIFIRRGVFTNHEVTIPFSRIQNVSISQGLFDKRFGLHTVKIETAGSNASSKQGSILPEGYMAGIRDPAHIERMIEKLVHKYTQEPKLPGKLQDHVFEEKDVAFDEFIAYILSKMREGDDVKNRIKELRGKAGLTQQALAEKVGVSRQTIYYLEKGTYNPSLKLAMKISRVLATGVEDLFILEESDSTQDDD